MIEIITKKSLFDVLNSKEIYIYGAGFIGRRFLQALHSNGLDNRVICFVVSKKTDTSRIEGFDVKELSEISDMYDPQKQIICLAVHESNKSGIENKLRHIGIIDCVWIYPLIHELFLGEPIKTNVKVPVNRIIRRTLHEYSLPIRLLVVGQYYGENTYGYDAYTKALMIYCELDTAKRRLRQFIDLIESCSINGYDKTQRLKLDQQNSIIDGGHRLALAYYYGIKEVFCDIYEGEAHLWLEGTFVLEAEIEKLLLSDEVKTAIYSVVGELRDRTADD